MDDKSLSPADLSLEAALELEEVKQNVRNDSPALTALFQLIRTPLPAFNNAESVSMLADVRAYPLLRDSAPSRKTYNNSADFQKYFSQYLYELEKGVGEKDPKKIAEAKAFCLALNAQVLGKTMEEFYAHRERQDSRSIFDNTVL